MQVNFLPVCINRPAQRGPDEAAERPRRGGLARKYRKEFRSSLTIRHGNFTGNYENVNKKR